MKSEKEIREKLERIKTEVAEFYIFETNKKKLANPYFIKTARIEYQVLQWVLSELDGVITEPHENCLSGEKA